MERLDGRVAFVTGGAQGIGLGIARALAREGVKLAIADINSAALEEAQAELSKVTPTETFMLDVRERDRFAAIADEVENRWGQISLLFNNAGVAGEPSTDQLTYATWDWMLGINLLGVINGIQTFVPRMIQRGGDAYIVNTASGAGVVMAGAGPAYTTSKFAVVGLSEALRNKLAKRGIGVSVLCPGYVATKIAENSASLNPAGRPARPQRPASVAAKEEQSRVSLAEGTPIDAVGDMVIAAIKAGRLYVFTDDMIGEFIERRNSELLEAVAIAPHYVRRVS